MAIDKKEWAGRIKSFKKLHPSVGLLLIVAGVLVLAAGYLTGLTRYHAVLLTAFVLVVVGVALYVLLQKWQSHY